MMIHPEIRLAAAPQIPEPRFAAQQYLARDAIEQRQRRLPGAIRNTFKALWRRERVGRGDDA